MKTIKIEIKLYSYNELNEEAKNKASEEHEEFLRENLDTYEEENENGDIITKYDNMSKWTQEDIKDYVEESINANKYLFFENGEIAHITHFYRWTRKSRNNRVLFCR